MKFGHFCLPTFFPDVDGSVGVLMRRWIELLAESEALGFDSLWANEHHFDAYGGIIPSPPTILAALSQRTRHARLGTSIVVLPLHSPIEIAEQLAMVDLMSGGRVEFGIGRGFVEFDYDRLGVSREDSQGRMREQLEVILKAWGGEPFTHKGRFYTYENLEVWPRPEQRPHPPIWLSCSQTPASFEWAGSKGYSVLTVAYRSVENLVANNRTLPRGLGQGRPSGQQMARRDALSLRLEREQARSARDRARGVASLHACDHPHARPDQGGPELSERPQPAAGRPGPSRRRQDGRGAARHRVHAR